MRDVLVALALMATFVLGVTAIGLSANEDSWIRDDKGCVTSYYRDNHIFSPDKSYVTYSEECNK